MTQRSRTMGRIITGLVFVAAGLNHFRRPRFYQAIMPSYMPWHGPLVAISGYAEVGLGALVCVPQVAGPAGWGLVALLAAVFPANVHMALHPQQFPSIPAWALWFRLPLQPALMAWVRWCTQDVDGARSL